MHDVDVPYSELLYFVRKKLTDSTFVAPFVNHQSPTCKTQKLSDDVIYTVSDENSKYKIKKEGK
jgi:hypothetical protein